MCVRVLKGFNVIFMTVSDCHRELNAASLGYHMMSQILGMIPPRSHYTDTEVTSPSPTLKIQMPSREQLILFLKTLAYCGFGSNLVPPYLRADTRPTALPRPVSFEQVFFNKVFVFIFLSHIQECKLDSYT